MKAPAFMFYVRDWMCSSTVQRMSGEHVKAYVYLLCAAWLEDERATLPDNDETLAAMARVDMATWIKLKPLIMTQFQADGFGRLVNRRLHEEHMRMEAKRKAALKREAQKRHRTSTALETETEYETAIEPWGNTVDIEGRNGNG